MDAILTNEQRKTLNLFATTDLAKHFYFSWNFNPKNKRERKIHLQYRSCKTYASK